jgi:class 3 adenylate cyclase/pimeloyl-ACP methyl ester carboxylesterase
MRAEDACVDVPKTHWAKTIDGAYIAYQDLGAGALTLVVIHGWISHIEVYWEEPRFARFMRRLARNLRVLHFDKRGTGMSDRFERPPGLDARMDDVRAVMDAAGVERAALLGWGTGGPPLGVFFAATHPERTVALCIDPLVDEGWAPTVGRNDEFERDLAEIVAAWGDEDGGATGFDEAPDDSAFVRWDAKLSRFAATPGSMEALTRMWSETDVRDILPTLRVPALVLHKTSEASWASPEAAARVAELIPGAQVAALPGKEGVIWFEDPEPCVSAIERFLSAVRHEEAVLDRVLSTVLFTDVVGSTQRAAALGDSAWKALIERHHQTVRALLGRYRGEEVDTAGDGFFATFDGPARAVRCAQAIVGALRALDLEIRAGVHTGEVETIDGKVGGIAVALGARVGALAGPSEVLVSQTVKDLVAGSGLTFEDAGEHELKGFTDRWHLYRVADTSP